MKTIDLITYLLLANPNPELKRTLGEIRLESDIVGIVKGDTTIDVWTKEYEKSENKYAVEKLEEVFLVHTINTVDGRIIASRKIKKPIKNNRPIKLY